MWIVDGGRETRLSVIKSYGMDITSSMALDMCKSPYQIVSYLLKGEWTWNLVPRLVG